MMVWTAGRQSLLPMRLHQAAFVRLGGQARWGPPLGGGGVGGTLSADVPKCFEKEPRGSQRIRQRLIEYLFIYLSILRVSIQPTSFPRFKPPTSLIDLRRGGGGRVSDERHTSHDILELYSKVGGGAGKGRAASWSAEGET